MMGWHGPQGDCGCCGDDPPAGCVILNDDFTREDGGPGPDWEQVAGSWSISSNSLTTASSNALLITTAEREEDTDYVVLATLSDGARIIFDYLDDENYHAVGFSFTVFNSRIYVYRVEGGIETQLASLTANTGVISTVPVKVCVLGDSVRINHFQDQRVTNTTITPHGGLRAGLGTEGSGETFSDFAFTYYGGEEGCDFCRAHCPTSTCCELGPLDEYTFTIGTVTREGESCRCPGDVAGEYTVEGQGGCIWLFVDPVTTCAGGVPSHPVGTCGIRLTLQLISNCTWNLTVQIFEKVTDNNAPCNQANEIRASATYQFTQDNPSDCTEIDYTMTLNGSSLGTGCTGEWPATVRMQGSL